MLLLVLFGTCDQEPQARLTSSDPVDLTAESVGDDRDEDGWPVWDDCDDEDPKIYPLATEICGDGIDQDCDGGDECAESVDLADADRLIWGEVPGGMAGTDVALADLDGDGLPEVLIAAPYAQRAYLVAGTEEGSLATARSFAATAWAVAAGSDLDGDGLPEVAIAAPYDEQGRGAVYLLERWTGHLEPQDADGVLVGSPLDHVGAALVLRPDSVWLSAPGACDEGAVYRADEALRDERLVEDSALRVCGPVGSDIAVGDVDGDGVDDLLASLRLDDRSAALLLSPQDGDEELSSPYWTGAGSDPSLAIVEDVDGDGLNDVVLGPWLLTSLKGGAVEDVAVALFTDRWGEALPDPVEGAGDTNDDGYGDLLLGDASGEGAAWLVQGPVTGAWAMTRSVLVVGGGRSGEVHGVYEDTLYLGAPWAQDQAGMVGLFQL